MASRHHILASADAPVEAADHQSSSAKVNEPEATVEEWLDTIKEGYGQSYGSYFHAHGATTAEHLHSVDFEHLRTAVAKVSDRRARNDIMAALRSHWVS
jgi:hypothetical protein